MEDNKLTFKKSDFDGVSVVATKKGITQLVSPKRLKRLIPLPINFFEFKDEAPEKVNFVQKGKVIAAVNWSPNEP